jgi:pSer/pThr/pTyr-binding forkhead associated (FHA) protein
VYDVTGKKGSGKGGNAAILEKKARKRPRRGGRKRAAVTITNGCFAGLEIALKKQNISLGRDVSCDICLDHAFVSDEHAVIRKSNGGWLIEDLNSRHGTSVNGNEIHLHSLKSGDRITIGTFELRFSC